MTPFHIVATSRILRKDILQALLDHYPLNVLSCKDYHDNTMMDYLLRNCLPKSAELIQIILEKTLLARVDTLGVESWREDMSERIESAEWTGNVTNRQQTLESIIQRFDFYGMVQVTSVLELALWKSSTMDTDRPSDRKRKRVVCDRDSRAD